MTNTLFDIDFDSTEDLIRVANGTPEDFRLTHESDPRITFTPHLGDVLPLRALAQEELRSRGVSWEKEKPVVPVKTPPVGSEAHIDEVLSKAAARMETPRTRRK